MEIQGKVTSKTIILGWVEKSTCITGERERAGTHASKTYYHRGKTIRPAAQTSQCSDPKPGYREDLEDSRAKAPINLGYILVQSSH
jgi:hypothetical protein